MDTDRKRDSGLLDKNGKAILDGSQLMYQGAKYLVMNVDKDEIGWIAHPIGGNPVPDDISAENIAAESEVIQ